MEVPKEIKTQQEYESALARIEQLMEAKLGTPEGDELDALVTVVQAYEEIPFQNLGGSMGMQMAAKIPIKTINGKRVDIVEGKKIGRGKNAKQALPKDKTPPSLFVQEHERYDDVLVLTVPISESGKRTVQITIYEYHLRRALQVTANR